MNTVVSHEPDAPMAWLMVGACAAMVAMGFGAVVNMAVFLTPLAVEFGWPRADLSLAYSIASIGTGLGGIAMGHFADRVPIRRVVLCGAIAPGHRLLAAVTPGQHARAVPVPRAARPGGHRRHHGAAEQPCRAVAGAQPGVGDRRRLGRRRARPGADAVPVAPPRACGRLAPRIRNARSALPRRHGAPRPAHPRCPAPGGHARRSRRGRPAAGSPCGRPGCSRGCAWPCCSAASAWPRRSFTWRRSDRTSAWADENRPGCLP